jgi:hypothetical protein
VSRQGHKAGPAGGLDPVEGEERRGRRPRQDPRRRIDEVTRAGRAAEAFGGAMFTDAEFGLLLRLVLAEIDGQENNNTERYCSAAFAAAWARGDETAARCGA